MLYHLKVWRFFAKTQIVNIKLYIAIVGENTFSFFEGVTPYLCKCGCEFEYDIEVGVKKYY